MAKGRVYVVYAAIPLLVSPPFMALITLVVKLDSLSTAASSAVRGQMSMDPQLESKPTDAQTRKLNPLRVYTSCVSALGVGLLLWCLRSMSSSSLDILLFIALVALAELTTSAVFMPEIAFTVSSAVYFAALLLFGSPSAAFVAMVGALVATLVIDIIRRRQGSPSRVPILQRALFNMASLGMAVVVAGNVYILCGGEVGKVALLSNLLPMVLAAACTEIANAALVVKAVSLQTGTPAFDVWKQNVSWALPIQLLGMVVGGGGLALGYQIAGPAGIGVFLLPVVLTIYAFKLYVRQTKAQMAHLEEIIAERTDDLRKTNEELKQLDRVKTRLFSTINHEMRNPLQSILGYTDLLLATEPLTRDQEEMLLSISYSSERLLDLVNNILDISRLEDGKLTLVPQTMGILPAVTQALAVIKPMAEQKHISINVDISETIPDGYADPRKVVQILVNLLSNAVKYTPDAGSIAITARSGQTDHMLEIRVSDDGIGIPADQLPNIFDCFSHVERAATWYTVGTGLGLYISNGLVEAQGGKIRVESEEGHGSCFTFTLPMAQQLPVEYASVSQ